MGKKPKEVKRVVLDTSVLISALLFKGKVSKIALLWKAGKILPLVSKETFEELRTALRYPKFSLSREEIKSIVENEILPFFEVIDVTRKVEGACRDSADDKFISCALSGSADCIVTGDKDLSDLGRYQCVKILKVRNFLKMFD